MFGHGYFGAGYFGAGYFGPALATVTPPAPSPSVTADSAGGGGSDPARPRRRRVVTPARVLSPGAITANLPIFEARLLESTVAIGAAGEAQASFMVTGEPDIISDVAAFLALNLTPQIGLMDTIADSAGVLNVYQGARLHAGEVLVHVVARPPAFAMTAALTERARVEQMLVRIETTAVLGMRDIVEVVSTAERERTEEALLLLLA